MTWQVAPAACAACSSSAMSSRDCSVVRLTFLRLCVSLALTTTSISRKPASSARWAPRRFGTSAEYRTSTDLATAAQTSAASAIDGMARGWTKETASIRPMPVRDSASMSATLLAVGTGASFCRPSRGPTSRRLIRWGRSLTRRR